MTQHRHFFVAPTLDSATPPNGAHDFNSLADLTRLSVRSIARLLLVRPDSVMQWRKGRRTAPDGVLRELREYLGMTDA